MDNGCRDNDGAPPVWTPTPSPTDGPNTLTGYESVIFIAYVEIACVQFTL